MQVIAIQKRQDIKVKYCIIISLSLEFAILFDIIFHKIIFGVFNTDFQVFILLRAEYFIIFSGLGFIIVFINPVFKKYFIAVQALFCNHILQSFQYQQG